MKELEENLDEIEELKENEELETTDFSDNEIEMVELSEDEENETEGGGASSLWNMYIKGEVSIELKPGFSSFVNIKTAFPDIELPAKIIDTHFMPTALVYTFTNSNGDLRISKKPNESITATRKLVRIFFEDKSKKYYLLNLNVTFSPESFR